MTENTDHREKLFLEFKESYLRVEQIRDQLKSQSEKMEELHKEAHELEREHQFIKRAVYLVLGEDMDPILAKFKISEEDKNNPKESFSSRNLLVAAVDDDYKRPGKIKRMFRAVREIWHERH